MMIRAAARLASICLLLAAGDARAATTIELLDAGAAPRAPLRYQFQAGTVERAKIEMTMGITREMNGQAVASPSMQPVITTAEIRVAEVAPDGSARLEMKYTSAESAPGPASAADQALNATLSGLSRMGGWYRVDPRGRMLGGQASLGPGSGSPDDRSFDEALELVNDVMDGDMAMLPVEPVGVGARWRVKSTQSVMGIELTTAQDYTLRSRQGDIIELDFSMQQPDLGSSAGAPGMRSSGQVTGTSRIDLRRLTPATTMDSHTEISMDQPTGGVKMTTKMRMVMTPEADRTPGR